MWAVLDVKVDGRLTPIGRAGDGGVDLLSLIVFLVTDVLGRLHSCEFLFGCGRIANRLRSSPFDMTLHDVGGPQLFGKFTYA